MDRRRGRTLAGPETEWPAKSVKEALGLLDQLDSLRADRPVVFLDVVRGESLIEQLTKLFRLTINAGYSFPEELRTRRPPLLFTLLWTGECFHRHTVEEWQRNWIPGHFFEEQLVTRCEKDSLLPIHVGCRCAKEDLIIEMANLRPELLQQEDANGMLPFEHALKNLRHPPSFNVWKTLLELYPGAHEHAFRRPMKQDGNFMENYVEWFPKSETSLVITEPSVGGLPFNADKIRALCRLLPQLVSLHINYMPGWETDAFLYFLNEIRHQSSILHLKSFLLPRLASYNEQKTLSIQMAFQQALEKNESLQKLELETREDLEDLSAILPWLRSRSLTDITFSIIRQVEQPQLPNQNPGLGQRIHQVEGPRAVLLEARVPSSNTNIFIKLKGHDPRTEDFWKALQEFTKLFSIHSLCVRFYDFEAEDHVECTGNLATTIQAIGCNLKKLQIRGLQVHVPTIIDALTSNPQLQELQISAGNGRTQQSERSSQLALGPNVSALLEFLKHNATLYNCPAWFGKDPRVQYYLDLNRLGRRHVRSHFLHINKLVDILRAASNDAFDAHPVLKKRPVARHSAVYGLLREAPSLWCHCYSAHNSAALGRNSKRKGAPV